MVERCTRERAGRQCRPLVALVLLGCSSAPLPESQVAPPQTLGASQQELAPELELLAALPIQAPENFQPSGLWVEQERLLVVSDKHDDTIYELELEAERAVARPFARFTLLPDAPDYFDWEGMSGDGAGGLLLVSESAYRVALIEAALGADASALPRAARWITPSLLRAGEAAGCFEAPNAGFEGLARLDDGALLLAIEREPRGLMDISVGVDEGQARAMPDSVYPLRSGRAPDFADLAVAQGNVYALMRNSHLIVRLERRDDGWGEGQAASYAKAENDPRFIYANDEFGLAEGLALTRDRIFVVLDNNGQARAAAPEDSRPFLFVFRRPPGF